MIQALLAIFDSRIAKAGRLKVVYVKTEKGLLIEIKPYVRLPRTQKRFYGVMCKWILLVLIWLDISAIGVCCDQWSFSFYNPFHWSFAKFFAVQLLQKLSITAAGKREKLFRVIKNPVTQYLPANSRKMGKILYAPPPLWVFGFGSNFSYCFLAYQVSRIVRISWSRCEIIWMVSKMM